MSAKNPLEDMRKKRLQFMHAVYQLADANELNLIRFWDIGKQLGFSDDENIKIIQYLKREDLIVQETGLGEGVITHKGIKEVEESMSSPDKPTEHFASRESVTIINVGTMTNSQMQVNSNNSTQSLSLTEDNLKDLGKILEELRMTLVNQALTSQQKDELSAEIQTVEIQAKSPKPKIAIIKEGLSSAKTILESIAEVATTAAPLIMQITTWLSMVK